MKDWIAHPFTRKNKVLNTLIDLIALEGPTSLVSAYRYYFESSLADPHEFTTYSRVNGKLRGNIKIENIKGKSVISPHRKIIAIAENDIVQAALANDAIYYIHGNKIYSIGKGVDARVRKEVLDVRSDLSKMVIPLGTYGLIEITGKDLTFGLLRRSTGLLIAKALSNLVTMRMKGEIDHLTGLLNRGTFDDLVRHHIRRYVLNKENGSIVLFDLDSFKSVNDNHGHPTGDRVLQSFASTALNIFRESDLLGDVARHGGEEFGVLLPGTDALDAVFAAERCKEAIKSNAISATNGRNINVTVSAGVVSFADVDRLLSAENRGVVIFPKEERGEIIQDPTERRVEEIWVNTMAIADSALYAAKREGRDSVVGAFRIQSGDLEFLTI